MTNIGDSSISHKPEYTNRSRQSAACKRTFILFVSPGDVTIYIYIYMKIPYIYIKNLGGNFHVNEPHKLISLLALTEDLIFRLRKLLSSVDLYYVGPALQRNK